MKEFIPFLLLFLVFNLCGQQFNRIEIQAQLNEPQNNSGIAVADIDLDGDLDVFLVGRISDDALETRNPNRLFANNNDGTFTDVTEASGITDDFSYADFINTDNLFPVGIKLGASWGDYNNDGYPDLFLTSYHHKQLFSNQGDGTFLDVTQNSGLSQTDDCYNSGSLWWDYDNDGDLDLYVTRWGRCESNRLFQNQGDGTFEDVTESTSIGGSQSYTWMAVPIDINKDGWLDLYLANDLDDPNELFISQEGISFIEAAEEHHLDDARDGMGLTTSDINSDQQFEIYVTNIDESSFYEVSEGNFINSASDLGIDKTNWAWGASFNDFDHDRDEDLVVANGFFSKASNRYYQNHIENDERHFIDSSEQVGFNILSQSNAVVPFDYDHDGDLDLLFSNTNEGIYFYENMLMEQGEEGTNWCKIILEGVQSNTLGFGAEIILTAGSNQMSRLYHGARLFSQSIQPVHFGLGETEAIDLVTIKWPSGQIDELSSVPINSLIRATEGAGFEVLDLSSNKILGCNDPNACNYNPNATSNDGSCTYLPNQEISGNSTAYILEHSTYSYPGDSESSFIWNVDGGKIAEGQGTNQIEVEWGVTETGMVSVQEIGICSSELVTLEVSLSIDGTIEGKSVARLWNEALLTAIRNDFARPTVHARNLFHASVALYDSWAVYQNMAQTYLLGRYLHGTLYPFQGFESSKPVEESIIETMSFASYRLLSYRFRNSPGQVETQTSFDNLMNLLGYNAANSSTDYSSGDPATLGNYIAQQIIDFGQQDGSREALDYSNAFYEPVNEPLVPRVPGNETMTDPNKWQPLALDVFIDQSGNVIAGSTPEFLSPEWGGVLPFSLADEHKSTFNREGTYSVFYDPEDPPYLDTTVVTSTSQAFQWGFSLVSVWGSHLDPTDGVIWDISPAGIGNIDWESMPDMYTHYPDFYDLFEGGDIGLGRSINPTTNAAYEPQMVPRGDYARVLAEFWADGPDSETPPGHWFTLLNYVSDHPEFEKRFEGSGNPLSDLEWDVKSYFALGGAMHDVAIAAWGIKGWYDYVRPISAIRYMASLGQSSEPNLDNYHVAGIPLYEGLIEVVEEGDPLTGAQNEHIGKIKLFTWRGHDYISDVETETAGVGWILADNWWPYQRPSFVTPPFAGYVSGHSTYSRAAAELLTLFTGDEYFPGGMGEFVAKQNEFLVFEDGPSQDVILQWATYRDASDQCSLSRIWGGIHPPADDIPGRVIGREIGIDAFEFAKNYFEGRVNSVSDLSKISTLFPNPIRSNEALTIIGSDQVEYFKLYDIYGKQKLIKKVAHDPKQMSTVLFFETLEAGLYILQGNSNTWKIIVH